MSAGGCFTFAGRSSREFGILVDEAGSFWNSPERDSEAVQVPGRNGDLIIDNGRWQNAPGQYVCGIGVNFRENYEAFRAFFSSITGYARLEDSWHPAEFRLAKPAGILEPSLLKNGLAGDFTVGFEAKPQRFLKAGETPRELTSAATLTNNTLYTAKPLLRVYGTGTFTIGNISMKINAASSYTDIDCDIGECYKDTYAINCNGNVELTSGDFPTLKPGNTGITLGSGITKIIVTPRWWTL